MSVSDARGNKTSFYTGPVTKRLKTFLRENVTRPKVEKIIPYKYTKIKCVRFVRVLNAVVFTVGFIITFVIPLEICVTNNSQHRIYIRFVIIFHPYSQRAICNSCIYLT